MEGTMPDTIKGRTEFPPSREMEVVVGAHVLDRLPVFGETVQLRIGDAVISGRCVEWRRDPRDGKVTLLLSSEECRCFQLEIVKNDDGCL